MSRFRESMASNSFGACLRRMPKQSLETAGMGVGEELGRKDMRLQHPSTPQTAAGPIRAPPFALNAWLTLPSLHTQVNPVAHHMPSAYDAQS